MISEDEKSDAKETAKNAKRNKPKRKIVSILFNLIILDLSIQDESNLKDI